MFDWQASLHVWKTVVANTPKTLKEIMPVLMRTLIDSLASTSSERRQVEYCRMGFEMGTIEVGRYSKFNIFTGVSESSLYFLWI